MENLYLTLISDASRDEFPDNNPAKFTTRLFNPLEFSGPYEIALTEISLPMKWTHTIFTSDTYFWVKIKTRRNQEEGKWYSAKLPRRTFKTGSELAKLLNRLYVKLTKRNKAYHSLAGGEDIQYFDYDEASGLMSMTVWHPIQVSRELGHVLGLEGDGEWISIQHNTWPRREDVEPVRTFTDLQRGIHHVFVYTDIVEYVPVADIIAPLLRIVPIDAKQEKKPGPFTYTITHPHYVPISRQFIETVQMDLRSNRGLGIPFVSGKSYCKLHIRKRRPL